MPALILIRGGGDLASGVALRLHRAGLEVLISELPQPLAVRRTVSFAEAVYAGQITVEGVTSRLVNGASSPQSPRGGNGDQFQVTLEAGEIPVIVDPDASILTQVSIPVVIDARLTKHPPAPLPVDVALHIGLGPGFHAGRNCHAVIETRRSHTLGRVYWEGSTQADSGQPEGDPRRVLRAPVDGQIVGYAQIGDHLEEGDLIAEILPYVILSEAKNLHHKPGDSLRPSSPVPAAQSDMLKIVSPFKGVLRGLIHPGLQVTAGLKIGDLDPRDDRKACFQVSDKALAIGGAVLEAILSQEEIRKKLWG
jgi:xanthine dehydrogenase accessory factor